MSFILCVRQSDPGRMLAVVVGTLLLGLSPDNPGFAQFSGTIRLRGVPTAAIEDAIAQAKQPLADQAAAASSGDKGTEAGTANSAEAARKKERLNAINQLIFDRRPSAILKSWATPATARDERPMPDGQQADTDESISGESVPEESVPGESSQASGRDGDDQPQGDAQSGDAEPSAAQEAEVEADRERVQAELERKQQEERAKREQAQFASTTKSLTDAVTRGQWDIFAATLNNRELLSAEEANAVFNRMLDQLSAKSEVDFSQVVGLSENMQQFMQQMMGNRQNNPAVAYAEKHVIQVPDLTGIIRSAPPEIRVNYQSKEANSQADDPSESATDTVRESADQTVDSSPGKAVAQDRQADAVESAMPLAKQGEERIQSAVLRKIAQLLRLCLSAGVPVDEFVSAMQPIAGVVLPDQDVAVILSAAGRDAPVAPFLPSIDDAFAAGNAEALNLWAKHYLALYEDEQQETLRVDAWRCTLKALAIEEDPGARDQATDSTKTNPDRDEALARAVALAPKLADDLGKDWLRDSFTKAPHRGQELMAKLGTATAQRLAQTPQDADSRGENLRLQHAAVDALLRTDTEIDAQWTGILNLLASNWLSEAQVTRVHSNRSQYGSSMRRDRYGNLYYADPESDSADQGQRMVMRQTNPVDVETILETAPEGKWFDQISESLKPGYTAMICRLWLKVNESEKAFPYIETLAQSDPQTARELAEEFIRVWTADHNPNQESRRTSHYMFVYGFDQKADKIPLTRSKQERNLQELSGWIERLGGLPLDGELDEKLLVDAFMTCHSVAEVYDIAAIEKVFGAWDQIEAGTMAQLINQMRANLASTWRDPNVQRDSKTNRKKQDIQAEVVRGYEVAGTVLESALMKHPDSWQLKLSRACLLHDQNEYLQEVSPSSEFTDRRQQAFEVFADAADAYIDVAAELPERKQSNDVFDHWFYASLGASDLSGISERNRPAAKQIGQIKSAMASLPGEVGQRHRQRFANALFTRMSAVSPSCKFRYLDAGFALVDPDDPTASEARKVYDYYRDLVTELELVTRVDGDARVGHKDPFGVYVDLRHTKELERESGGFSKYLQNQNSGYRFYYNYGRPTENYRDKFEESVASALEEHFEVLSVTFSHPETNSVDAGNGWRVTPYAYLLLKARGPEVDKLPAVKLDMDFLDTSGHVVLPIDSSPLPIDAGTAEPSPVSIDELKMVQLLDERQAAEGKLIVEARATARGLVPPLKQLLDTGVSGFKLVEQEDSGVGVIEFDKESTTPIILSERTWTLTYAAADPAAPAPAEFTFPAVLMDAAELQHQRYVDADLEDVEATVSLVRDYGSSRRRYLIAGIAALAALVLTVAAVIATRRFRRSPDNSEPAAEIPLTPVTVLSRLQAVRQTAKLEARREQQLASDIEAIESHFFAGSNGQSKPDLHSIAARWIKTV